MCRQWLQQLSLFLLSILLFGCGTSDQSNTAASADLSIVKNIRHHISHHGPNAASDPENEATQDYYDSQFAASEGSRDNLWSAIRQNFQMDHYANNPEVRAQISWFVHNQGYLDRTSLRAAPFMYYIYQEVKARHLPSELVLLPIIESAYNPFVSSYAGASGLWQLVPGTARNFGIRQDWWYDGRRDITASTKAALDYLGYLQNYFGGNWLLALGAYNAGQGTISSAIHRNARAGAPTDFWSLRLPAQTEAYVPRLLALAVIINNPQAYGVHLPPINNSPYLGQVEISSQITLDKAAQLAGMSLAELKILNSGYKASTLSPNQPYKLLLPIDRIPLFRRNLLGEPQHNTSGLMNHYKVQPHDTWQKIARRFDSTVEIIQAINRNEDITPPVGSVLTIPENASNQAAIAKEMASQPPMASAPSSSKPASSGDAIEAFTAAQPDLSAAESADNNPVTASSNENTVAASERPHLSKITHTVKSGETLHSVARLYRISEIELAHWNRLSDHAHLKPGMELTVFQRSNEGHAASKHISPHHKESKHFLHHSRMPNDH
jgi:membrane-bound lytic murein transglycosylase D